MLWRDLARGRTNFHHRGLGVRTRTATWDEDSAGAAVCDFDCDMFQRGRRQGLVTARALRSSAQQNGVVEQGKFVLHKFEQAIGEETYKITREGDSVAVKVEFKFTDRGTPVPLSVTLRAAQDLTPSAFEIKGKTSRQSTIDETVEIQGEKVRVRDREKWTRSGAAAIRTSRLQVMRRRRCRC